MYCQMLRIPNTTGVTWILSSQRHISTSSADMGKRNFRNVFLANKRGTRQYKLKRHLDPDFCPDIPVYTSVKPVGYRYDGKFKLVPEMIPDLIVPDTSNCPLKPYVSYRAADTVQSEFTAKELFSYVYQDKIEQDFKNNKLDENGSSFDPSTKERQRPSEAYLLARRVGSDIFSERIPKRWECLEYPNTSDK